MLQVTCPLRSCADIDNSLKKLIKSKAKSITSIVDVGANHPYRMKVVKKNKTFKTSLDIKSFSHQFMVSSLWKK